MQIAAEVRRVLSKHPAAVRQEHFRLHFRTGWGPQVSKEQATHYAKAKWMGFLKGRGVYHPPTKSE